MKTILAPSSSRCLCRACGEFFSNVGNFDRHRRNGECRPPGAVGLVLVADVWKRPNTLTTQAMARFRGAALEARP